MFGLHDNANIISAIAECNLLLGTVLTLQPKEGSSSGSSAEDQVLTLAKDIEKRLPENYDVVAASTAYPVVYSECMNTVLVQELIRFNRLLTAVRSSLVDLQKAMRGEVVLSASLEEVGDALRSGRIPKQWSDVAYPSLKPLGSWVTDLLARLKFFDRWIASGPPSVYWISGFFFTQSFLTGTLQNYARRKPIAIDEVSFEFVVMPDVADHSSPPRDGCYINGLFLEGAGWDAKGGHLCEALPRQLQTSMPPIWLKPVPTRELPTDQVTYPCPVYKTGARAGTLSTTGHSTNYIITIQLPSQQPEKHWVLEGVALLCSLST